MEAVREALNVLTERTAKALEKINKIDDMYARLLKDYDVAFDNFREFMKDEKDRKLKKIELLYRIVYGFTGIIIGLLTANIDKVIKLIQGGGG